MKISIITLFPEVFDPILKTSILKRAQKKGKVEFELINLRDFGEGKHQIVDGRPYGGGAGMLLKADTLSKALKSLGLHPKGVIGGLLPKKTLTILTSASGKPYKQTVAQKLSKLNHLIIVCGHYEGVDQRFIEKYVDEEISIGDYVLTGGEIPAMVIADSVVRLLPGVLKKPEATVNESFSTFHLPSSTFQLLEHPQYTRPEKWQGKKVPSILLSGNHQAIEKWQREQSIKKTKKLRPDLLTQKG